MKEITKKEFTGIFKEEFENFLRYKNALGYYKKIEGNLLYDYLALNRFLDSYKLEEIALTEEMTFAYVKTAEHLSQSTRHHRECNIRQFAKFLKSQGYENIYIQYDCTVKMPRDYIPYVFSNAEMKRIFSVIDSRESAYDRYDSRLFYQTLIRLLYCTGLRLGEALELKISDIDFTDNIIIVNSGKGNVSRLVPFKASLGKWLINYNRKKSKPGDTYFFESPSGGRRCNHSITTTFRKNILPKAGVSLASANGHSRGPCIHSLRHTFACNALDQMIKEGKDPYCALPYLSVYLGHTDITNTEIYLRLTMERYDEVINVGHYIYEGVLGGGSDD